jgi:hypothetical protein
MFELILLGGCQANCGRRYVSIFSLVGLVLFSGEKC